MPARILTVTLLSGREGKKTVKYDIEGGPVDVESCCQVIHELSVHVSRKGIKRIGRNLEVTNSVDGLLGPKEPYIVIVHIPTAVLSG